MSNEQHGAQKKRIFPFRPLSDEMRELLKRTKLRILPPCEDVLPSPSEGIAATAARRTASDNK